MCPILDGYGVMGVFKFPYTPSCEPRLTAGSIYHRTLLRLLFPVRMQKNVAHDFRYDIRIYAGQQVTQSVSISELYSSRMLARHVSDLTGPSSGAFYKPYLQIWYVVIRSLIKNTLCILLDCIYIILYTGNTN